MLVLSASTDSGGDFLRPIFCFKILLKSLLPVGMGLVTNQHCKYITAPHHSSTFILNTRHCLGCSKPRRLLPYGVYSGLTENVQSAAGVAVSRRESKTLYWRGPNWALFCTHGATSCLKGSPRKLWGIPKIMASRNA